MYDYHADDLTEDEVDYELCIRGARSSESDKVKRRELRVLLQDDRKNFKVYPTTVTLEQEENIISSKIREISEDLARRVCSSSRSRLLSLRNRVLRAVSTDAAAKGTYVKMIDELMVRFFDTGNIQQQASNDPGQLQFSNSFAVQTQSTSLNPRALAFNPPFGSQNIHERNSNLASDSFQVGGIASSSNRGSRPLGSINLATNRPEAPSVEGNLLGFLDPPPPLDDVIQPPELVEQPIRSFARHTPTFPEIQPVVSPVLPNPPQELDPQNRRMHSNPILQPTVVSRAIQQSNSCPIYPSTSTPTDVGREPPQNQIIDQLGGELRDFIKEAVRDAVRHYVDELGSCPTPNFSSAIRGLRLSTANPSMHSMGVNTSGLDRAPPAQGPRQDYQPRHEDQHPRASQHPPNYYNHLRTKIEKWQVFFSGEIGPKSLSVSEFIRQVTILAKANRVSDEELLQQSYIFFAGEARKWYFTYWEKFLSWKHLVYYLTVAFENPNKDKAIEDEMRERKQRPNERFSTYLADMERLSQSLSQKMSQQQKLKLIFENTKLSYRRRLALFPINSINELSEYCYQFDALEPSLYAVSNTRPHISSVHQVDTEQLEHLDLNDSDSEEINAISNSKSSNRNRYFKKDNRTQGPSTSASTNIQEEEDNHNLVCCWNCRDMGHLAKNCQEPKRVYCYACGEPNVSKNTCPKQHNQAKNEGQRELAGN